MTKIYGYDTNIYETTIGNISNYCQEIKGTQYYTEEYVKILQQKVEQLEKENKELKYDCSCSFHDAEELNQELNEIIDERNELDTKLIQLENIRKEAIEYILKGRYAEDDDLESISIYVPDLLNILNKGDNKE